MRVKEFAKFINTRERYRVAKETGRRRPTSGTDPIIEEYRFCNVRRNDDRVTKWIHGNILEPFQDSPDLWFFLVIARLFNNPDTLRLFTYAQYQNWSPETWRKKLKDQREKGTIFNAAYIVSTNGLAMDKVDYVIDRVLAPLWRKRKEIGDKIKRTEVLSVVQDLLQQEQGLGSFMAAQVIADLKYAHPSRWADFHTFAASGPGSRRGLNRVCEHDVNAPWREDHWRAMLKALRDSTNLRLKMEPLTAQDIQNCLCEFDKYERARLGEGKPKQKYVPFEEK